MEMDGKRKEERREEIIRDKYRWVENRRGELRIGEGRREEK